MAVIVVVGWTIGGGCAEASHTMFVCATRVVGGVSSSLLSLVLLQALWRARRAPAAKRLLLSRLCCCSSRAGAFDDVDASLRYCRRGGEGNAPRLTCWRLSVVVAAAFGW